MKDFNIIIGQEVEGDEDLFFGPVNLLRDIKRVFAPEEVPNMQTLLKTLDLVNNTKQARDLNLIGAVPLGFTDLTVGKKKVRLSILNLN